MVNTRNIFLLFILFSVLPANAQTNKKKRKLLGTDTYFGLRYSYTIAGNFIQKNDVTKQTDSSFYNVKHSSGYLFGAEVRHNFTKYFAIQTGVNFIRRNYDAFAKITYPYGSSQVTDSNRTTLQFIAYELPVKAMYFIRLSSNIFMNLSAGPVLEFYPSDIYYEHFYGQRNSWILAALDFDIGWEYRSKNWGTFHIGGGYKMMFTNMLYVAYTNKNGHRLDYVNMQGNYFSIDLKYYFPIDR